MATELDYYVWSGCEIEVDKQPHFNIEAVKVKI